MVKIFQKGIKPMTVQELIDKLSKIEDKNIEVKFVSNQTLEDYKIVDILEGFGSYDIYLEYE